MKRSFEKLLALVCFIGILTGSGCNNVVNKELKYDSSVFIEAEVNEITSGYMTVTAVSDGEGGVKKGETLFIELPLDIGKHETRRNDDTCFVYDAYGLPGQLSAGETVRIDYSEKDVSRKDGMVVLGSVFGINRKKDIDRLYSVN